MHFGIVWGPALNLMGFAFSMVFVLLVFIVFALNVFGLFFKSLDKASKNKEETRQAVQYAKKTKSHTTDSVTPEIYVAIAMALHTHYKEVHDNESNILTMEKVGKRYTPWSSKIYGLNIFSRRA